MPHEHVERVGRPAFVHPRPVDAVLDRAFGRLAPVAAFVLVPGTAELAVRRVEFSQCEVVGPQQCCQRDGRRGQVTQQRLSRGAQKEQPGQQGRERQCRQLIADREGREKPRDRERHRTRLLVAASVPGEFEDRQYGIKREQHTTRRHRMVVERDEEWRH